MDPVSVFAIAGAAAALISAFRDGLDMFKDWRKKRKEARRAQAQVVQLEQSLQRNPPEVEREYKRHVCLNLVVALRMAMVSLQQSTSD